MGCARTGTRWRWPRAVIPYIIDPDDFPVGTSPERATIANAIAQWEATTPIRFVKRTREPRYAKFVAAAEPDACSSRVGMQPGRGPQAIMCNPSGSGEALVHEIGHAAGLWHEQSREDRDSCITVLLENVRSDKRHNYDRHVGDGTDVGGYDYASMMHYSQRAFAIDWRPGTRVLGHRTRGAPVLASVSNALHQVHLGESSSSLWHSWSVDGNKFTIPEAIPEQSSKAAPALVEWNQELHLVHLGETSNDIWYSHTFAQARWSRNARIPGQKSQSTPAIAVHQGELHMVHRGDSSNSLWHSWTTTANEKNWTTKEIKGQRTKASPALASYGGQLHLVHLGDSSNQLWHSWSDDGRDWEPNEPIEGQLSQSPPDMAGFEGRLHIAHAGDESPTIWHSSFRDGRWRDNTRNDNNETYMTPAVCVFKGELYSLHKGRGSKHIYLTVRDTGLLTIVVPPGVMVGQRGALSTGDIATINSMYP